jgi:hypothetical protein
MNKSSVRKMKSLIAIILVVIINSCSQKHRNEPEINMINGSAFNFFKVTSGIPIYISASETNITSAFGNPALMKPGISQANEQHNSQWIYKGAILKLQSGRMINIDLNTPAFAFDFNGFVVKVGEDIEKLKNIFPASFSARSSNHMVVGLHFNGEPIDSRISFAFNGKNRITSISLIKLSTESL